MKDLKTIYWLISKDLKLEWREKYAISALFLYVASTVFVIYEVFLSVDDLTWVSLYWIINLFAALNASSRLFGESYLQTQLYYYTIVSARAMILSKMIFNALMMGVLALLSNSIFILLLGFPIEDGKSLWFLTSIWGSMGLGIAFTMIAAIASKARNSGVMMAILGLPVMIPQLLILIKLSKQALADFNISEAASYLTVLSSIDAILIATALVFFPFIWRD